jgi:hypothetical protein
MTFRRGPHFIPVLVCALVSVGCARIGIFGFFFLVPLGITAFGYDLRTAWSAVAVTVLLNGLLFGGIALVKGYEGGEVWRDMFYFSAMAVLFGWITAPPVSGPRFLRIRTAYRFAAASLAGALAFFPLIASLRNNAGFYAFFSAQMEVFNSLGSSGGADVVRRSLLEQLTPEILLDYLEFILIRGGGVASCMLLFFISRQTAAVFTQLIRRQRPQGSLSDFHVEPGIIWVLSGSLLAVLLGTWAKIAPLEIAAWNIITLCGILYLAQGGGIVLFFLNRFAFPPVLRLAVNVLLLVLLFNPGISPFILGILIVLGIAENWAPFRVQKSNGPSSTPKMEN